MTSLRAKCRSFIGCVSTVLLAGACGGPASSKPAAPTVEELREFVITGPAPEESNASEFFGEPRYSQIELLNELAEVAKQPKITGVFLQLSGMGGAWARSSELRGALARVREAKKPVHCYFDETDNSGYALLASSCDRISMEPTGLLSLTGVQAQAIYAHDLLQTVGVQADLMQVGRYKGAADPLTRSDMPSEVRENLSALLDDLQGGVTALVTHGRGIDPAALQRAIDAGPQTAQVALEQHLIDAISFADEARARAKAAAHAQRILRLPRATNQRIGVSDVVKALFGAEHEQPEGQRIALAYLSGVISDDEHEHGSGSASGPFIAAMRRFGDDKDVRALVLRINSPGGSALASDKMWHAVRRVAKRKPVIVSVGDMAASGGYYVACAGSEIFAEDDSLVGSIGVVGGKIVAEPLADRLGVHVTALARGRNAGWTSPFQPFTDSERSTLMRAMNATYATFISRVSEGRKLSADRIDAVAEGRIMSGKRARAGGLVDTSGGLQEALARARSKTGLPEDATIEIWPKERSVLERAAALLSASAPTPTSALATGLQALPEFARSPIVLALMHGDTRLLAALPYVLRLE